MNLQLAKQIRDGFIQGGYPEQALLMEQMIKAVTEPERRVRTDGKIFEVDGVEVAGWGGGAGDLSDLRPINCRRCAHTIAHTDGENIWFGGHKVPLIATGLMFLCPECKQERKWRRTTTDRKELRLERD